MREDQYIRLQALGEKLADAFLDEADPDGWSGAGKLSKDMDKSERGDRYWCKRNAAATGALLLRVGSLTSLIQRDSAGGGGAGQVGGDMGESDDGGSLLEREIQDAEAEGRRLLDETLKKQRRADGVAKLNGRP